MWENEEVEGGGVGILNTVFGEGPTRKGQLEQRPEEGREPATWTWGEQHPGEGNGNAKAMRQEGAGSSEQGQWWR